MKKKRTLSICSLTAFILWTILVKFVDVQPIGPQDSVVGLAAFNAHVHSLTGVNWSLYAITDLLSVIPLGFIALFGCLGLCQWIKRKNLFKVDHSLLVLGGFYIVVMTLFLLFEILIINYRPVLIGGILESSYPSSTTLLVLCVMPTAIMQFRQRSRQLRFLSTAFTLFTVFMVIGRILSGVHWITDIIGGIFLSTGLVLMYTSIEKTAP